MKILILGSGGREHVLGWKIKQSTLLKDLYFAPGNAGTSYLGENLPIQPDEIPKLLEFALSHKIDLTVVGPETPLVLGIAEEFSRRGLCLFGPDSNGAKLEGSKLWAKQFMVKHQIPTAPAEFFTSCEKAEQFLESALFPVVIKADGLAQGKGVVICKTKEEARQTLRCFMVQKSLGKSGETVLIESFLEGEEISCFAFFNGSSFVYLGEARDYKKAYDKNQGPNTGGMGAVSSSSLISPQIRERIKEQIFARVLQGLLKEKIQYRGILYAGLILTHEGAKILEFNARFGDPEAQVLIPRIQGDLLPFLLSSAKGEKLSESISLCSQTYVGVVVAAKGYPGEYKKGMELPDLKNLPDEILAFHSATSRLSENSPLINQGGRTLTLVSSEKTLENAASRIYTALNQIQFHDFFYRTDIGRENISPAQSASMKE
jgi:phosphoribosylamine--glycine ligase